MNVGVKKITPKKRQKEKNRKVVIKVNIQLTRLLFHLLHDYFILILRENNVLDTSSLLDC